MPICNVHVKPEFNIRGRALPLQTPCLMLCNIFLNHTETDGRPQNCNGVYISFLNSFYSFMSGCMQQHATML